MLTNHSEDESRQGPNLTAHFFSLGFSMTTISDSIRTLNTAVQVRLGVLVNVFYRAHLLANQYVNMIAADPDSDSDGSKFKSALS